VLKFSHRFEHISKRSEALLKRLDELYANQPFRALLVSKFIYGTRFLTVVYLSLERVSALRFLVMNFLSTFLWLVSIVAIGWFAGKSIFNLIPIISDVKYALLFIVLLVISLKLAPIWFQKKVMHEEPPL
jgi:membrane protein DedA with SNARE-associated domain